MAKHLLDPQKLNPSWKTEVSKSSWIKPWLDVRHCASYHCMQIRGKLMKQTWENGKKPSFGTSWGPFDPNSGSQIYIFWKIWLRQPLDVMVSYHHVQYQKNLMIQSWENLERDGRTDRQMDQSDFTGRCPTNVEHPKIDKTKDRLLRKIRMRKTGRQTNEN